MITRIIAFDWRIERLADLEAMSPTAILHIFDEYQTHERWKRDHVRKPRG